ncbi:DUF6292 family protein [Streptomyces canus]|uniref:DUF6292 family protein n=1 Tax=Streptomyces canus TaxID=58343 RepID=UPI002DD85848|nr:DUF6292 family protein [Streptomyces canus]WSD82849.1 DUF6292 family protein [Streptomyces canus]WSD91985.1 DUF6292 family protein [Streptomyces canus]WSD92524.1 DUF6292 family protein [Streptomyces canus]
MLLDPPGPRGKPQGMPHWPYVKAVDHALTARGIPPGTVRASHHGLERGLTTYITLAWDVSRTSGRGGIRLDWEERQGWYYALTGLDSYDVLLYTVVTALRTPVADPERVADVAEDLLRFRRVPNAEYREEWEGARGVWAAANDFRRSRLGLAPRRLPEDGAGSERETDGVQLTIDTQVDTYERALAAVKAAYGRGSQA